VYVNYFIGNPIAYLFDDVNFTFVAEVKLLFIPYCTGFQQTTIYQADGNVDTANLIPFQSMLK